MLVGFGKYPTLDSFHCSSHEGKVLLSSQMEHLISGPHSIKFKIYASAPMKVRLMVKFTNRPLVVPTSLQNSLSYPQGKTPEYSSYFFKKIPLEFPTEFQFRKKVPLKDFIENNIRESKAKDNSRGKLIKDRSLDVAQKRALLKKQHEDFLMYKKGADLMQEHERCQKQIDKTELGKNRVICRYLLNYLYLVKVFDSIRDRMMVDSAHQGPKALLLPATHPAQALDPVRVPQDQRDQREEVPREDDDTGAHHPTCDDPVRASSRKDSGREDLQVSRPHLRLLVRSAQQADRLSLPQ